MSVASPVPRRLWQLAGVLGALAAIPVAGSLQVIFRDWLRQRRGEEPAGAT